ALTASHVDSRGDHRQRPHINSIMVTDGVVQLGLFGTGRGDFGQSQIIQLSWKKADDGSIQFSSPRPLPVSGFRYPHNVHVRADGTVLGCSSAEGELRCGDRNVKLGAWPRGVAVTPTEFYVALSSCSYGLSKADGRVTRPESNAAIVRVDRATLT